MNPTDMSSTTLHAPTPSLVIRELIDLAPAILSAALPSGHCVAATRVTIDVLAAFGITATALPTRVEAGNALGFRLSDGMKQGRPMPLAGEGVPHMVTCGFSQTGEPRFRDTEYALHLVALVDGATLVDTATSQFSGSGKGSVLPTGIASPVTSDFLSGMIPHEVRDAGAMIRYHAACHDLTHRKYRVWCNAMRTTQLTHDIINAIAARLRPARDRKPQFRRHQEAA